MRIKRTYAATMREALALVKQEQGPDAVILGNKKVPGGVEILSAIDFDHRSVDAYAGDPSINVSSSMAAATPAEPLALATSNSGFKVDELLDQVLEKSQADRKEPVLGVGNRSANSVAEISVASTGQKVAQPKPAIHSQPLQPSSQKPQTANNRVAAKKSSPRGTSGKHSALPVEEEARLREQQADKLLNSIREEGFKSSANGRSSSSGYPDQSASLQDNRSNSQMIDEVKGELQNLRSLMQNQLSILEWDRYNERHPVRSVLLNLMTELGLGTDICELVFSQLGQFDEDPHKLWQKALGLIAQAIPMSGSDILNEGGRIALVGSTGVGKTTTIAKLAARFAHMNGNRSVALVTTDNFRIGAQEQLQHFARMLEIPLLTANDSDELTDRLKMLADKKLVLIDTAGMSQTDIELSERFHMLQTGSPEIQPYLVLSANTQLAALNETIKNFSKTRLAGTIVTKLDESASLGGIITTAIRHQLPLSYCGTGQRVPEDLKLAKNHTLVSRAVSLMQKYGEQIDKETLAFRYQNLISSHKV